MKHVKTLGLAMLAIAALAAQPTFLGGGFLCPLTNGTYTGSTAPPALKASTSDSTRASKL
jgi:hypothetical protein